jgi:ADP-ribose pyrophosphatase
MPDAILSHCPRKEIPMPILTVADSKPLYKGRVFSLHRDTVALSEGAATTTIDVIRHPGASAVVPVSRNGRILLIRQYRYCLGQTIWEIPAGTVEPGETPMACARRELEEEAGVTADQWDSLTTLTPVPGYSDERIHLFVARGLTPAAQRLDPDEILEPRMVSWKSAIAMIRKGEIGDAKTICGIYLAREYLESRGEPMKSESDDN